MLEFEGEKYRKWKVTLWTWVITYYLPLYLDSLDEVGRYSLFNTHYYCARKSTDGNSIPNLPSDVLTFGGLLNILI